VNVSSFSEAQEGKQVVEIDGLGEEQSGTLPHRPFGAVIVGVRGDQHDRQGGVLRPEYFLPCITLLLLLKL